jgi:plastocyanin
LSQRRLTLVLVTTAIAFTACSAAQDGTVAMVDGFRFEPSTITVEADETVTFVNESSDIHTVTGRQGSLPSNASYFSSGGFTSESAAREDVAGGFVEPGDDYSVTLEEPGTYPYFCIPHESSGMEGTIVVEG